MFRLNEIWRNTQQCLQPVLWLLLEVPIKISDDESKFIALNWKFVLANQQAAPTTKNCSGFWRGLWIELVQDLCKIWTQNTINEHSDRTTTMRSLLQGETLTAFESALLATRMGNMEFAVPDWVVTLGLEEFQIRNKQKPEDWVRVEVKHTCWENIWCCPLEQDSINIKQTKRKRNVRK